MKPVQWGVLSTAGIGLNRVIPAMQQVPLCSIRAIASRDGEAARAAAKRLSIERTYGSYQALLDDPDIEAVYIPLPNHLHVEWCAKAMQAGKHVLCEKPIALTAAEAEPLHCHARSHLPRDRGGVCDPQSSAVERDARLPAVRRDRRAALGAGDARLQQHEPQRHSQQAGHRRRCAVRHRQLRHRRLPLRVRGGTGARGRLAGSSMRLSRPTA